MLATVDTVTVIGWLLSLHWQICYACSSAWGQDATVYQTLRVCISCSRVSDLRLKTMCSKSRSMRTFSVPPGKFRYRKNLLDYSPALLTGIVELKLPMTNSFHFFPPIIIYSHLTVRILVYKLCSWKCVTLYLQYWTRWTFPRYWFMKLKQSACFAVDYGRYHKLYEYIYEYL
jgi:hypothetical protein